MANEQTVTDLKRLGLDLREFKAALRKKYSKPSRAVSSPDILTQVTKIAESWLADLAQRQELMGSVSGDARAEITLHFQRLLTFAEHSTMRRRYDKEIKDILKKYTTEIVVPAMQGQKGGAVEVFLQDPPWAAAETFTATAFVGHSFETKDETIAETIIEALTAIGFRVVTGEKPEADRISEKVKRRIEANYLFVGVFTRRDKLVGKGKWNTSPWVIEEKAYASAKNKKLILLRETGIDSIGGLHGDYEYIQFSRETLDAAIVKLLQTFEIETSGFRAPQP